VVVDTCSESRGGSLTGLFYQGVNELLAIGNGGVYDTVILERWWRSSQMTEPAISQSFLGTPASLPFHAILGVPHPLWLILPAALVLWLGLKKNRPWMAAVGLVIVAFRMEWALCIFLGLLWRKHFKTVVVAGVITTLLWVGSSLFWGSEITGGWLNSLQHPPASVNPGFGLMGLIPGDSGAVIPMSWFVYGLSACVSLEAFRRMPAHQAVAFSLVWALVFSPQVELVDWLLLIPLFLAFFPHPARPALVAFFAVLVLSLIQLPQLIVLVVLFLLRMAWLNSGLREQVV
jgi:hypothetical protein